MYLEFLSTYPLFLFLMILTKVLGLLLFSGRYFNQIQEVQVILYVIWLIRSLIISRYIIQHFGILIIQQLPGRVAGF